MKGNILIRTADKVCLPMQEKEQLKRERPKRALFVTFRCYVVTTGMLLQLEVVVPVCTTGSMGHHPEGLPSHQ